MTNSSVKCLRCGQEEQKLSDKPYPGALGETIFENIGQPCWEAWRKFSVNVINEFKLRPFMPKDRAILEQNMKKFLNLEVQDIHDLSVSGSDGSPSKEEMIERLKQIFDPEIPVNIYDLGLIYDIQILDKKVSIQMSLTSKHCPAAQSLPAQIKEVISRTKGVEEVFVEVVWDPPWTRDMISPDAKDILGIT